MLYLVIIFIFLFGLVIGSFLNCLIWRLHKKESIQGRSYCPKCRHQIVWYDNLPVLSFIILHGKCRHCGKPISWQYPMVELMTGVLFLTAFVMNLKLIDISNEISDFRFQISDYFLLLTSLSAQAGNFLLYLIRDWFLIAVMIIIFVYDLRWYLILDVVTLPACAVIFVLNLILGISLGNLLMAGVIGAGFFFLQFIISRGRWIGGGDIRLGLLMGLALGWPMILVAIFIAYFVGSIIGVGLIIGKKKKWGSQIPLGVFLSASTVIVLFWGNKIVEWYLDLF